MTSENPAPASGGPDQEVAKETVKSELPHVPIADADHPLRFAERLLLYLREWVVNNPELQCARDDAAVFLFSQYPRLEARAGDFELVPLFDDKLSHPMLGHVHLCTTGVADVHRCALAGPTSHHALEFLAARSWDTRPTVVFYPGRQMARYYPRGLTSESERSEYSLTSPAPRVTREVIGEILDRFYDVGLRVPGGAVQVWKSPTQFIPIKDAEKEIQNHLVLVIRMRVPVDCLITPEWNVDGTASRADIGIVPPPGDTGDRCVIEVKALRSQWSSGRVCNDRTNEEAVAKGLDQAVDYRTRTSAHHAFLACYDLRRVNDDAIRQKFAEHAAQQLVDFRRYYVHNSSDEERRSSPDSATNML